MKVLNYIWLLGDKKYYDPKNFASESYIPAEYLNNVISTAKINPNVKVYLWLDFKQLSRKDITFLAKLNKNTPDNLIFKDLNVVKAYREEPILHDPSAGIWKKVNYSRLIVADHVLKAPKVEQVFYSDLDLILGKISSTRIQKKMRKGYVFCWTTFSDTGTKYFENGFFGFDKLRASVLRDKFIPATLEAMRQTSYRNEWPTFRRCTRNLFKRNLKSPEWKAHEYAIRIKTIWGPGRNENNVSFDKDCAITGQPPRNLAGPDYLAEAKKIFHQHGVVAMKNAIAFDCAAFPQPRKQTVGTMPRTPN
ncbi:MAG: hypothetical protein PHW76_07795 [Alphaproteobacteria bacterium]|nr:hypothetical protein [Alphaproteobacteria bacterium]